MDALIEYATKCPECSQLKTAGDTTEIPRLSFDPDLGGICCPNGHVFETLPEEPEANGPEVQARAQAASEVSAPSIPETAPAVESEPAPSATGMVYVEIPAGTYEKGQEIEAVLRPVNRELVKLPGGRVGVFVILEEFQASAVQAECENLRRPFVEYFQEWVNEALSNYWGNLPLPKK